jgi:hypothetical protein
MTQFNPEFNRMTQPEKPISEVEKQIRQCAEKLDQAGLLNWIEQAKQHPENPATKRLVAEALRIDAHGFFGKTKGAISSIYGQRPLIRGQDSILHLREYEENIRSYLEAHNMSTDQIIDRETSDENEADIKALDRLSVVVSKWDDQLSTKEYIASVLSKIGERDIDSRSLRMAISATSMDVTENMWEVVKVGRESVADLLGQETPYDQISMQYINDTDVEFTAASKTATEALQGFA